MIIINVYPPKKHLYKLVIKTSFCRAQLGKLFAIVLKCKQRGHAVKGGETMERSLLVIGALLTVVLVAPFGCIAPAQAPPLSPTPTAEFQVAAIHVAPPEVTVGERASVRIQVMNIGSAEGIYTAKLTIDGVEVETKDVTIVPGTSELVIFHVVKDKAGTYQVAVGGLSSSLTVREKPGAEVAILHQKAWKQAAANCGDNNYYKYSIYSARSLAVSNPEVYLQADTLWMDMISTYGGWESNYLAREREPAGTDWWEEIGEKIHDGFRHGRCSRAFKWESFNWEEHRKNAVDIFDFYGDAEKLNWVDNRLVFLWNAMKGLNWKLPYTSLAEAEYLKLSSEGKQVYLMLTEDRKGYVAELTKDNIILHNSLTGDIIDEVDKSAVLVMNNEHVWYPLMGRDDRGKDTGLEKVVGKYCEEDKKAELTEFEESILGDLREGTKLESEIEFSWARLLAIRAVNQYTWRSKPLRELSAKLFPKRYEEDSDYSDSPYEQQCLGMVITEMGNRLSPTSAIWAEIVQKNASESRKAFEELGKQYWERFHRTDSHSEFVYGDYYRCWFPNLDDKLISGIGNCIVEATNAMAALSLADLEEWEIYETNWWSLERSGGHVICGAYTPYGNYSLSNGLFPRGKSVLHGPLRDANGRVAYNIIYDPKLGFVTFVQTKNAANFSDFVTPFTNLSFEETVDFLQHVKALEEEALIAEEYFPTKARTIDEYIEYITQNADQWETNMASWPWDTERR